MTSKRWSFELLSAAWCFLWAAKAAFGHNYLIAAIMALMMIIWVLFHEAKAGRTL